MKAYVNERRKEINSKVSALNTHIRGSQPKWKLLSSVFDSTQAVISVTVPCISIHPLGCFSLLLLL